MFILKHTPLGHGARHGDPIKLVKGSPGYRATEYNATKFETREAAQAAKDLLGAGRGFRFCIIETI